MVLWLIDHNISMIEMHILTLEVFLHAIWGPCKSNMHLSEARWEAGFNLLHNHTPESEKNTKIPAGNEGRAEQDVLFSFLKTFQKHVYCHLYQKHNVRCADNTLTHSKKWNKTHLSLLYLMSYYCKHWHTVSSKRLRHLSFNITIYTIVQKFGSGEVFFFKFVK